MSTSKSTPPTGQQVIQQELHGPLLGSRIGWVTGIEPGKGLHVDYSGNPKGSLLARSIVPMDPSTIAHAVASRQQVVLLFEEGDPTRPIMMGFVQPANHTPLLDTLLDPPNDASEKIAVIDGQRVVILGEDEIVLSCGEASITLRRNGRVIIKGTYIEAHSEGIHRIKGGSIQFN